MAASRHLVGVAFVALAVVAGSGCTPEPEPQEITYVEEPTPEPTAVAYQGDEGTTTWEPAPTPAAPLYRLTDPESLAATLDVASQKLAGRGATDEEKAAFVEQFHAMERGAQDTERAGSGEVVLPDAPAQAEVFIREVAPTEVEAHSIVEYADMAMNMMKGPTPTPSPTPAFCYPRVRQPDGSCR